MGTGILVCGLNGTGKSTLGKALAEELQSFFIDSEDLYFPKTDAGYLYAVSRTRKEAQALLFAEIKLHEQFVYSAVQWEFEEPAASFFRCAVLLDVPKEIRMQRVKARSYQTFGNRMLPGGDLYEREQAFFAFAASRSEHPVEEWAQSLHLPIIRVDGTRPIAENARWIAEQINKRV